MMEDHLICEDLVEHIQNENVSSGKNANEWNVLNRKAVATIQKYIARSLFQHVLSCRSTRHKRAGELCSYLIFANRQLA